MHDLIPGLALSIIGAIILLFVITLTTVINDHNIADSCNFAGKVRLHGAVYECKKIS